MEQAYAKDIQEILSHRHDNGADLWTTADRKLLKGAPFTTLESVLYLLELGMAPEEPVLREAAELIFSTWHPNGRFRTGPGGSYPCQTALALDVLCRLGLGGDERCERSFRYFLEHQQEDGGWKCNKYSFGRGEETAYSTPYTTLVALDAFRFSAHRREPCLDWAVDFLLRHWDIRMPISPCHYGMGTLFMQVEYPFRGYGLFYYVYVLSHYPSARRDRRFLEAFSCLRDKTKEEQIIVERVVPKLAKLSFCRKGAPSALATKRYEEILKNLFGGE